MNSSTPDISVVVPVYNSEDCVESLVAGISRTFKPTSMSYEIVLVNDASRDSSWMKIRELVEKSPCITGIDLRRNFGQDSAIMAGLHHAHGRFVVIMDDDLQHDPADIPRLVEPLEKGKDVCYANFSKKRQALLKNLGSWFNDKVANIILKKPKGIYLSPFKAIRGEVVREILEYTGPYPYIDGLLFRVTSSIVKVDATHHARYAGKGNYTLRKSIRVWSRLATNFSITPLRFSTFIGFVTSLLGFALAVVYIVRNLIGLAGPQGWASLMVVVLCIGGVQLVATGIIGEYIGRLFLHHSKQPQFIVREQLPSPSKEGR